MFLIESVLYTFLLTETLATFVGISVLGGILWPRANRWGALASLLASLATNFLLYCAHRPAPRSLGSERLPRRACRRHRRARGRQPADAPEPAERPPTPSSTGCKRRATSRQQASTRCCSSTCSTSAAPPRDKGGGRSARISSASASAGRSSRCWWWEPRSTCGGSAPCSSQSLRRAAIGFTRVAPLAGAQHANVATSNRMVIVPAATHGS